MNVAPRFPWTLSLPLLLLAACGGSSVAGIGSTSTGGHASSSSGSSSSTSSGDAGAGRCGATAATLAIVSGGGNRIAVDQGIVFFTSSDATSSTLHAVDGAGAVHTVASDPAAVTLLGADSGFVVWATGIAAHLYAAPSATFAAGSSMDLAVHLADYEGSFSAPLRGVANGYVLWSDGKAGFGRYWSLAVPFGSPSGHTLPGAAASAIAAAGSILWFTDQGVAMIGAVPDAAGAAPIPGVPLAPLGNTLVGYRAGTAYLSNGDAFHTGISAVDVKTGMVRAIDATTATPAASCAMPGKWGMFSPLVGLDETLYASEFTDCAADAKEHLGVIRVHANALTQVAGFTSNQQSVPLAVDEACLYWIENDGSNATLKTIAR